MAEAIKECSKEESSYLELDKVLRSMFLNPLCLTIAHFCIGLPGQTTTASYMPYRRSLRNSRGGSMKVFNQKSQN